MNGSITRPCLAGIRQIAGLLGIIQAVGLVTGLVGGLGSAWAAEDGAAARPDHAAPARGYYLGAGLGSARYDELNDHDAAFTLFGGIDINKVLAVEASWTDLGEASAGDDKTSADTLSLSILGKLPLSTEVSLYGKLGLANWNYDATISGVDDSASSTDVYYGVGANYDITGHSSIRFSLDMYSMKPGISGISSRDDISHFFIGYTYRP